MCSSYQTWASLWDLKRAIQTIPLLYLLLQGLHPLPVVSLPGLKHAFSLELSIMQPLCLQLHV